jgi:hypothetical protein
MAASEWFELPNSFKHGATNEEFKVMKSFMKSYRNEIASLLGMLEEKAPGILDFKTPTF